MAVFLPFTGHPMMGQVVGTVPNLIPAISYNALGERADRRES